MEYLPENRRKLVEEAIGILQQLRSEAGRGSSENSQTSQPASNFSDQQHSLSASSGPRHRRLNSLPHLSVVDRGDGIPVTISASNHVAVVYSSGSKMKLLTEEIHSQP